MQQLHIVVASPGDVRPERDLLPGVLEELNRSMGAILGVEFRLYRWETDAYPGFHPEGPQGLIDPILHIGDCAVLIGIFWKRFGTPTMDAGSGTEHEIRTAHEAWQRNQRPHIMMYFKETPYFPQSPEEIQQLGKVLEFKAQFPKEGLWWPFTETEAFKDLVRGHLSNWLQACYQPHGSSKTSSIREQLQRARKQDFSASMLQ